MVCTWSYSDWSQRTFKKTPNWKSHWKLTTFNICPFFIISRSYLVQENVSLQNCYTLSDCSVVMAGWQVATLFPLSMTERGVFLILQSLWIRNILPAFSCTFCWFSNQRQGQSHLLNHQGRAGRVLLSQQLLWKIMFLILSTAVLKTSLFCTMLYLLL